MFSIPQYTSAATPGLGMTLVATTGWQDSAVVSGITVPGKSYKQAFFENSGAYNAWYSFDGINQAPLPSGGSFGPIDVNITDATKVLFRCDNASNAPTGISFQLFP